VIGFICNLLVKAVDARFHMKDSNEAGNATAAAAAAKA
jgi:hypothetical protein